MWYTSNDISGLWLCPLPIIIKDFKNFLCQLASYMHLWCNFGDWWCFVYNYIAPLQRSLLTLDCWYFLVNTILLILMPKLHVCLLKEFFHKSDHRLHTFTDHRLLPDNFHRPQTTSMARQLFLASQDCSSNQSYTF